MILVEIVTENKCELKKIQQLENEILLLGGHVIIVMLYISTVHRTF